MPEDSPEYGSPITDAQKTLERAFRVRFEQTEVSNKAASQIEQAKERISQGHTFQWSGTKEYPDLLVFPPQEYDEETRWILAKEAVCKLDISQRDAAEKYGLSYETLKKRCQREEWPILNRVKEQLGKIVPAVSLNREIAKQAAENWSEKAELARSNAWKLTNKPLEDMVSGRKMTPEVESWSDVATIVKLNRQAAGLDTGEATVSNSFNFTMLGDKLEGKPVVEIQGEDVRELPE